MTFALSVLTAAVVAAGVPDGLQRHGPTHVLTERVQWTPKPYARHLLARRGQSWAWSCLERLWQRESRWNPRAVNASSGAGGIPQALPPSKMGRRWREFRVQVRWGVGYVFARYGGPCGAWAHSERYGWY